MAQIFSFSYENVRVTTFPCFYSRAFNQIVVARYSWDDNLKHLILSIIIPNVLFAVSIGVLSYWYCPCCDKACHKNPRVYAEFPTAKEKWVELCSLVYSLAQNQNFSYASEKLSPLRCFLPLFSHPRSLDDTQISFDHHPIS